MEQVRGDAHTLRGVDLDVPAGEVVASSGRRERGRPPASLPTKTRARRGKFGRMLRVSRIVFSEHSLKIDDDPPLGLVREGCRPFRHFAGKVGRENEYRFRRKA